jgi:hypothetical protein
VVVAVQQRNNNSRKLKFIRQNIDLSKINERRRQA